ncbi:OmpH family outer membrane protein [Salidesulfovibrio onnuriiensis]|uniref:OmpH family outer membrane protein n=1 Tax=Salidesulfovibrio onnuriiensis TaxID=2583823 RepID=UPI0011CA7C22|nr:OmpH family outer membrane protein [Salidesulfovibrio onnuriiensis]
MKRIAISLILILGCLTALAACNAQGPAIGVLDEAAAFRDNNAAKAAMDFLQERSAPLQAEAEAAYKAMQAEENEDTTNAYREAMTKLKTVMGAEQQRVVSMLSEEFNKVIDEYRTAKGLSLVVNKQSVLSMDESVDITKDVIEAMNKLNLDFAVSVEVSETPEPAAAAPAPEKAEPEKAAETKPEAEKPADDKQ